MRAKWVVAAMATFSCVCGMAQQSQLSFDVHASHVLGKLRPLQDLDNGPLCERGIVDLSPYYKALGVHIVRLHDVPWTYDDAFDINYVFPHWDASVENPHNYDFTQTDYYLNTILSLGIKVIYRLGYSAEYKTSVHHNSPPSSYQKFASIAEHIVRHHNQGWANGSRDGIEYWEIWNEPDGKGFWNGTPEQYARLYETTSKALKRMDPTLKVGGPALAQNLDFLEQFLRYSQSHHSPIDFVSWHSYAHTPQEVVDRANRVHAVMEKYGYGSAESILDEWNYGPDSWGHLFTDATATAKYFGSMHDEIGAAFDAAVLMRLQDAPVNVATFYSGTTLMWGLFDSVGVPLKPYYAFLAFRRLLDSPNRIATDATGDPAITVLGGISDDKRVIRLLVSNTSAQGRNLNIRLDGMPWSGTTKFQDEWVDHQQNLEPAGKWREADNSALPIQLRGESVVLLTICPSDTSEASARD